VSGDGIDESAAGGSSFPSPRSAESLARWHLTPDDLGQAGTLGELAMLSVERAFGGRGKRYDVEEVAAVIGADPSSLRLLWRSLGFTEPRPGEQVLSDTDLQMLAGIIPFLADETISDEVVLQMTRVIGSAMERVATAQVDTILTQFDAVEAATGTTDQPPVDRPMAMAVVDQALAAETAKVLTAMPDVLEFVWRRHLVNASRRRLLRRVTGDTAMCVGFADLVGFTAQAQQLSERELAAVVERFEKLAYDVVTARGGRVVKMIGDEVLFVADDIATGAQIALSLSEAYREDAALSDVRVGLAAGQVLEREGDVYGPVVNLASRIVAVAFPGSVVVSAEVAAALAEDPSLAIRSIRSQPIKDIGTVPLWTLRPADAPRQPARTRTARHHLRDRQSIVGERRAERQVAALERAAQLASEAGAGEVVDLIEQLVSDGEPADHTGQVEAITDAVLAADIDPDLQIGLLADIDAVRRLGQLEDRAAERADEADVETQGRILAIEADARHRGEQIEADARRQVEAVLAEAERRVTRVSADADRHERRLADEVGRKAERAERDALRRARRRTIASMLRRRRRSGD